MLLLPRICVRLVEGEPALSLIHRVTRAMRHHGVSEEQVKKFCIEATSGDRSRALEVVRRWVEVRDA
jgi:hypothetical protein